MSWNGKSEKEQSKELPIELPRLPLGWCWSSVKQVAEAGEQPVLTGPFGSSLGREDFISTGVPLLTIGCLTEGGITLAKAFFISSEKAKALNRYRVRPGDILFSRSASVGRAGLVTEALNGSIINYHLMRLRLEPSLIDPQLFIYFVTGSSVVTAYLREVNHGATRDGINTTDLLAMPVPVPPLKTQRRIVAKIDELFSDLDAGVAALKRAKANLKNYRAAVLKAAVEGRLTAEWRAEHPATEPGSKLLVRILADRRKKWEADQLAKFAAFGKEPPTNWKANYVEPGQPDTSGLPELPLGWCWTSVDQVSEVQGGIQKQPKRIPRHNSFPFLRVANVYRNRLNLEIVHHIELFPGELERLRLQPDDLLVVEGNGSKAEIGRSAIWNGEIDDCVHQNHIIRVRFLAGSSRYLNSYWNSSPGNARVMERAASTSGLYTLSVTKVCALPIPLPPLVEQSMIVAEVESRLSVIAASEAEIERSLLRAGRLRQSILKQAFQGKLVPQDASDEPASVLLDRLRLRLRLQQSQAHSSNRAVKRRNLKRPGARR